MVFSSAIFMFYFLPIVLMLYVFTRGKLVLQNVILFLSSFVFYFWGEKQYTVLVLASVFFNYVVGIAIDRYPRPYKTGILWLAIVINLLVLFYYKYFGFLITNIEWLTGREHIADNAHNIHLPLGISFFTFHGLTYVIDIYRKDAHVSHNPLNVGLYTLFFPQLVAGPIVRYKDIDQQLTSRRYGRSKVYIGVRRFIIGFAKKLIIANTAGEIADNIYGLEPHYQHASILWLAAISYSIQIYFDFSGYSDMAIGLAKIFGFDFLENFNFPYSATSIKDFWRRWHISLSTFFRDYVYIPLGGNKKGRLRTYINLFIVFFLTGFWHGASWNYVFWGLYHGSFLVVERLRFERCLERMPRLLRHIYTLFVVVTGWVFFRVEDFNLLKGIIKKMFWPVNDYIRAYDISYFLTKYHFTVLLTGIIFSFPVYNFIRSHVIRIKPTVGLRFTYDVLFLLLFIVSLSFMASSTFNPFIYFRF